MRLLRFAYDHWLSRCRGRGRLWRLRMCAERCLNGYCREDVWSVDCFLGRIVPCMLRDLQDSGYPGYMTQEGWNEKLGRWADEWQKLADASSSALIDEGPDMAVLHESLDYIQHWWC